jgi:transposase
MGEISMIGLDLAKNVFQVHGVDASGSVVLRRQLRRGGVEKFFAQLPPCTVGIEACGSAHHWARVIGDYGHQVRLMPPAYVKPYVKRNKNDGRDAEAIYEAVGRPTMRFVPVKSVEQQATLAVHTTRALLVRQRTMIANSLRAALSEIGIVAAQGIEGLRELMAKLEAPNEEVPEIMRGALLLLAKHWQALDADERALERQITKAARADREARRLMEVPCVGPIIASTVLAKVPDAKVFRSGRDFAAWIGLTGRDHGTGGKHRPGRISKQGDRMLRALLISGASAYLRHQRTRGVSDPWLRDLLARRPYKVVMVALAAKTARILWAMLVKGEPYRDRASAPGCCLVEGRQPPRSRSSNRKGNYGVMAKWSGNRDRNTPLRHRASQRAAMIGIRSAISIRARGQRPHSEAVYMTAPRSVCPTTKKALAERGPSIHDDEPKSAVRPASA